MLTLDENKFTRVTVINQDRILWEANASGKTIVQFMDIGSLALSICAHVKPEGLLLFDETVFGFPVGHLWADDIQIKTIQKYVDVLGRPWGERVTDSISLECIRLEFLYLIDTKTVRIRVTKTSRFNLTLSTFNILRSHLEGE